MSKKQRNLLTKVLTNKIDYYTVARKWGYKGNAITKGVQHVKEVIATMGYSVA